MTGSLESVLSISSIGTFKNAAFLQFYIAVLLFWTICMAEGQNLSRTCSWRPAKRVTVSPCMKNWPGAATCVLCDLVDLVKGLNLRRNCMFFRRTQEGDSIPPHIWRIGQGPVTWPWGQLYTLGTTYCVIMIFLPFCTRFQGKENYLKKDCFSCGAKYISNPERR